MSKALYLDDSYLKEFEAKVVSVKDGKYVVLDKTVFYPNSGGQPYDAGVFIRKSDNKEFKVVYVGKFSGEISHEIGGDGLMVGDDIIGRIDWDRRYKLMRMHTACHVLAGIIHKETGAMITGNQLDIEKSRIDFSLENFNKEEMANYIQKSNEIIAKNLGIKVYYLDKNQNAEEFLKLAKGLPPDLERIRIVEIEDFDKQPDGGTHVKNTSEIGNLELIKCDNKGANFRRVYFRLV